MYIILGKNGYIAEAIVKELKSRDLPHVALKDLITKQTIKQNPDVLKYE